MLIDAPRVKKVVIQFMVEVSVPDVIAIAMQLKTKGLLASSLLNCANSTGGVPAGPRSLMSRVLQKASKQTVAITMYE